MKEVIGQITVPANNLLLAGAVPANYWPEPLSNVRNVLAGHASGCWCSALGAGVPYNREKNESLIRNFCRKKHYK